CRTWSVSLGFDWRGNRKCKYWSLQFGSPCRLYGAATREQIIHDVARHPAEQVEQPKRERLWLSADEHLPRAQVRLIHGVARLACRHWFLLRDDEVSRAIAGIGI